MANNEEILVLINNETVKKYESQGIIDIISSNYSHSINVINNNLDQNKLKTIITTAIQNNILIIGGHKTMPFFSIQNPVNDSDPYVLSDLPYISMEVSRFLVPNKKICRIPDDESNTTPDFLVKVLKNSNIVNIKIMSNYGSKSWEGTLAEFKKIYNTEDYFTSPPNNNVTIGDKVTTSKDIIYLNLHGLMSKGGLYGQDGNNFPLAFNSNNIVRDGNCLALVTSCYGGYIIGRDVNTSVPLKLLYSGCSGVLCSTNISYGGARAPLSCSDLLINLFLDELFKGNDLTTSLFNTRKEYMMRVISTRGRVTNEDKKTLLQFQIYGNPLTKINKV